MPKSINRRSFLRSTGIVMGLPLLSGMHPRGTFAGPKTDDPSDIRRMLAICVPLGIHTPNLFPRKSGKDYEVTPYLKPLQGIRNKFSLISGVRHPDVDGAHLAEKSFLTGAAHPGQPSFQNTISADQLAAEQIGHHTRFSSLTLAVQSNSLSFSRSGVKIPSENDPSRLFAKLFLDFRARMFW